MEIVAGGAWTYHATSAITVKAAIRLFLVPAGFLRVDGALVGRLDVPETLLLGMVGMVVD